ncbi:MAG: sugar phosphate isomerase/epimerase [Tepidisphaeraceae bacterium]
MNKLKLSVQLYTLREAVDKDLAGTLKAVRAIGLTGVELAGYGDLKTAAAVKKAADEAGVVVSGAHVMLDALEGDFAKVLADHKTLGNTNVVIPWLPDDARKTAADWIGLAAKFNTLGKKLAAEGFRLSYHNHAFEFDLFDGQTAMNLLLQHTDPAFVDFEVDVYWVKTGGHDPVQFLQSLGSRLRLVHLKDKAADGKFAPVGTGTLDFAAIAKAASDAGVEWGVIEQDDSYGQDPLKIIQTGYENLKKLGYS